jgi:hypothetical protein
MFIAPISCGRISATVENNGNSDLVLLPTDCHRSSKPPTLRSRSQEHIGANRHNKHSVLPLPPPPPQQQPDLQQVDKPPRLQQEEVGQVGWHKQKETDKGGRNSKTNDNRKSSI